MTDSSQGRAGDGERWGWCPADDCPTSVCGGVHREVLTSLGIEIVRDGLTPHGVPVPPSPDPSKEARPA